MGIIQDKMNEQLQTSCSQILHKKYTPVDEFQFHDAFPEDFNNGLFFNNIYLPEELLLNILSYVNPNELLNLTLVCKQWCNIIKSHVVWRKIFKRHYPMIKSKKLPWYVYYNALTTDNFVNLIKNGTGKDKFNHWKIIKNFGDEFRIENPPIGVEPLPSNVPEFNGEKGCFATSFYECNKVQIIYLENKRLLRLILDRFKPHIYVSEWVAGRFDCGCVYKLIFTAYDKKFTNGMTHHDVEDPEYSDIPPIVHERTKLVIAAGEGIKWQKVELLIKDYQEGITTMIFEHEGHDTQFWKGHYGSKMSGGVVKILFDSIKEIKQDDYLL